MSGDPQVFVAKLDRDLRRLTRDCQELADTTDPHTGRQAAELFRRKWPRMFSRAGKPRVYQGGYWREELNKLIGTERALVLDDVCAAVVGVLDAAGERGVRRAVKRMNESGADFANLPLPAAGERDADRPGRRELAVGFLGGAELADALSVHPSRRGAFEQQLSRKRKSLGDDCWHQVQDARPNAPRYLYRADSSKLQELAKPYQGPEPV
jgi:hypothetical protein